MAASNMVFTSSASGRVPIDQLIISPSKQSIMGDRYALPAGIWNSVMSVCHFSFGAEAWKSISGTPKTYSVRASSGSLATRSFCADCGTPLFTQSEANPEFVSIRFPSPDQPSQFQPMLDIWTSSAQPWVCLDQTLPHFPSRHSRRVNLMSNVE